MFWLPDETMKEREMCFLRFFSKCVLALAEDGQKALEIQQKREKILCNILRIKSSQKLHELNGLKRERI